MGAQLIRAGLLAAILLVAGSASIAAASSDVAVKKSRNSICHERGSSGYEQTKHFKEFRSIEACLKSGGRRPKTSTLKTSHFDPSKPAHPGDEGVLFGQLVRVIDGDTIVVKIQGAPLRIRLVGIDAPEADQRFGDIARYLLAGLIDGQECVLAYDEGDSYGRLVAHLWIGDMYVNAEMVRRGMAYFDPESAPDNLLYLEEEEAEEAQLGLWALPPKERVPLGEWRDAKRASQVR